MKRKSLILSFFVITFLSTNCTIQKRTFKKGYFVQWNFNIEKKSNYSKSHSITNEDLVMLNEDKKNPTLSEDLRDQALKNDIIKNIDIEKSVLKTDNISVQNQKIILKQKSEIKKQGKKFFAKIEKRKYPNLQKKSNLKTIAVLTAIGFLFVILGVILIFYSLSKSYQIIWAFLSGMGLGLIGIVFVFLALLLLVSFLIEKRKVKVKDKERN